jgi:hypothetical protein
VKRVALIIALVSPLWGQIQGNRPDIVDASNTTFLTQPGPNQYAVPENVAVNDTIDVCVASFDSTTNIYAVTDTLGNTYTTTAGTQLPVPIDNKGFIYHAYTRSAFSGADTITVAQPSPTTTSIHLAAARYKGLNGVDGSVATGTENQRGGTPSFGTGTVGTTNTTTVNGDVLSACIATGEYNQDGRIFPSTGEYTTWGNVGGGANSSIQHQHTGLFGSQSMIANTYAGGGFNGAASFAMQTLAFKPDAIKITDTLLPDCLAGSVCSMRLHSVGGTAALTYACTGLPSNGLSLNTSTGVISATTPTVGTVSIGCTVTDGTITSGTASLTIHIYASLQTPTIRTVFASGTDANNPLAGLPWQTVSASCNDILIVFARGIDTHYFNGGIQVINGTNNYLQASNLNFRRLEGFIPGVLASGFVVYVSDPLAVNGNFGLFLANNQGASSANPVSLVLDVSGGELVDQAVGTSTITNTSTGTWGGSYTTLVNNTLLIAANLTGGEEFTPPIATMSLASPFSTLSTGGDAIGRSLYSSALISTPQTVNATITYGSGNTSYTSWMQALLPIRPAPANNACPAPAGELLEWTTY